LDFDYQTAVAVATMTLPSIWSEHYSQNLLYKFQLQHWQTVKLKIIDLECRQVIGYKDAVKTEVSSRRESCFVCQS